MITLHQTAPWNTRLRNPYRTRYAQVGGRYFSVAAENLTDFWWVYEIDADGQILTPDGTHAFVGMCWQLNHARLAIDLYVNGATKAEIDEALNKAPRPGTGKNAPKHVAQRRQWRTR